MKEAECIDGRLAPLEERRLIEATQQGCRESARALVAAHQDRLHAFVWRMVRNHDDADELCQEAFLRALQAIHTFDFAYRFSTWLFTIGYRLSLNALRRRRDFAGEVDFSGMASMGRFADDRPATVSDEVANSDEARRLKKVIWESVELLSPQQRAAVLLFYREALSCQDIGEIMGVPASTVKSHLHRARGRLKELLSKELVRDWSVVSFEERAS